MMVNLIARLAVLCSRISAQCAVPAGPPCILYCPLPESEHGWRGSIGPQDFHEKLKLDV